jgi:diacylglycerol kinase
MAVAAWIVAWVVLAIAWKDREPNFRSVLWVAFVLIALGFIGSFPPVYDLFTR